MLDLIRLSGAFLRCSDLGCVPGAHLDNLTWGVFQEHLGWSSRGLWIMLTWVWFSRSTLDDVDLGLIFQGPFDDVDLGLIFQEHFGNLCGCGNNRLWIMCFVCWNGLCFVFLPREVGLECVYATWGGLGMYFCHVRWAWNVFLPREVGLECVFATWGGLRVYLILLGIRWGIFV